LNVKQFHAVTHPKFEAAEIDTPEFAVELMADPREWEAAKIGSSKKGQKPTAALVMRQGFAGGIGRGVEI
jgi:hypothetical protein